jgi:S1-C subfamily serine protease
MIDLASYIVKVQYSKENTEAVGAGFFITSAGHILTCQHVIDNVDDENEVWVSWIKLIEPVKAEYCKNFSDSSDRMDFAVLKVSLYNPYIKLPPKLDIESLEKIILLLI